MPFGGRFRPSRLAGSLGFQGGEIAKLADGPVQPVAVVSDFSQTQAPQLFEARGTSSFADLSTADPGPPDFGLHDQSWCMFEFMSRAPGGALVEQLTLNIKQLGSLSTFPVLDPIKHGLWVVVRRQLEFVDLLVDPGAPRFEAPHVLASGEPLNGLSIPGMVANVAPAIQLGGQQSQSDFVGARQYNSVPTVIGPNLQNPELVLPNPFVLSTPTAWYVPTGFSLFFVPNDRAPTPLDEQICDASITFRDLPDPLSSG